MRTTLDCTLGWIRFSFNHLLNNTRLTSSSFYSLSKWWSGKAKQGSIAGKPRDLSIRLPAQALIGRVDTN
jgi:hypothetical protein